MKLRSAALVLALAARAAAADPFFDAGAAALVLPAPPAAPAAVLLRREPPRLPLELLAAAARIGTGAMLARLPPHADGTPVRFGVVGDSEPGRFAWERIFSPGKDAFLEQWRALQPTVDFAIQLGDFVSEGDVPHYLAYAALLQREARTPLLHCVGNHDRSRPNGSADKFLYDSVFGPRDWHFDRGGWRFISLDSSDRRVTKAQLAWLKGVLAAPGPKVLFTHVPPAYLRKVRSVGGLGAAAAGGPEPEPPPRGYWKDFRENYFNDGAAALDDLIVAGGVKAVFMGHIHAFWAGDHRGVRYVISGGGGSPLYPLPPGYPSRRLAHVLRAEAGPDGLAVTVVPKTGAPFVLPPTAL